MSIVCRQEVIGRATIEKDRQTIKTRDNYKVSSGDDSQSIVYKFSLSQY